jgi:curved DNA-binding protein CbpA
MGENEREQLQAEIEAHLEKIDRLTEAEEVLNNVKNKMEKDLEYATQVNADLHAKLHSLKTAYTQLSTANAIVSGNLSS